MICPLMSKPIASINAYGQSDSFLHEAECISNCALWVEMPTCNMAGIPQVEHRYGCAIALNALKDSGGFVLQP